MESLHKFSWDTFVPSYPHSTYTPMLCKRTIHCSLCRNSLWISSEYSVAKPRKYPKHADAREEKTEHINNTRELETIESPRRRSPSRHLMIISWWKPVRKAVAFVLSQRKEQESSELWKRPVHVRLGKSLDFLCSSCYYVWQCRCCCFSLMEKRKVDRVQCFLPDSENERHTDDSFDFFCFT